jgi:two-component system sensor histidine kinase KdpD
MSLHPDERPDPDALLAQLRAEEARGERARLKIFFGAAPGVGKTYAMLEAARHAKEDGIDLVVGAVETHDRAETAVLLAGLDVVSRRTIDHRGVSLDEVDLEAALQRKPDVVLVDELAHTNAPGSRHAKRWQDVLELLPRRHRRVDDAQRAARREPRRRRPPDHRRQGARDRAGRRDRARR